MKIRQSRGRSNIFFVLALIFPLSFLPYPCLSKTRSLQSVQLLYRAKQQLEEKNLGAARSSIDQVIALEPDFAEAYLLKASVLEQQGQYEEANQVAAKAFELKPSLSKQVRKKLDQQAQKAEGTLTTQPFSNFELHFHGAEQRNAAWDAVSFLNGVYNEMGSRFSYFPSKKMDIYIFTDQQFWDAWHLPGWVGGFFDTRDGKIRIRLEDPPGGREEYRRRLRHEFTHAYFRLLVPKNLPTWFEEGSAQFYGYMNPVDSFWKDYRLKEISGMLKSAPWLTFEEIQKTIREGRGYIGVAYLESEALCLYTAKQRGDSWIPLLIDQLRQGKDFTAAFMEVTGVSPSIMLSYLKRELH